MADLFLCCLQIQLTRAQIGLKFESTFVSDLRVNIVICHALSRRLADFGETQCSVLYNVILS